MQPLSLPPHKVSLHRNLEDFPIEQFLRFQQYWEQPLLLPDPDTADAAAWSGQAEPADTAYPSELDLLLRAYGSTPLPAVAITPHHLAFTKCIAALNGKPVDEIPPTAASDVVALLRSYGLREDVIESELTATRQATLAELTRLFPTYFAQVEEQTFAYTQRQRRLRRACAAELADLHNLQITLPLSAQRLQDCLLDLLQPVPWGEDQWRMAQTLRQQTFSTLCTLLRTAGTTHPERLAVASFVRALAALLPSG